MNMEVSRKQTLQDTLSGRMSGNVDTIMPKIMGTLSERTTDVRQKPAAIDLATAENHLLRQELVELCRDAIAEKLTPEALSYPRGFGGEPGLLEATSSFLNHHFKPHLAVEPNHVVAAAGATACLDGLLFSLCDPDDAVLVAAPFWSEFCMLMSGGVGKELTPKSVFRRLRPSLPPPSIRECCSCERGEHQQHFLARDYPSPRRCVRRVAQENPSPCSDEPQ